MANGPRDVVLVDGIRTPFAKADTKLKNVHPAELGRAALKEVLARTNLDPALVDEVIVGNTGNPPDAVNIARVVALNAGIPQKLRRTRFTAIAPRPSRVSVTASKKLNREPSISLWRAELRACRRCRCCFRASS